MNQAELARGTLVVIIATLLVLLGFALLAIGIAVRRRELLLFGILLIAGPLQAVLYQLSGARASLIHVALCAARDRDPVPRSRLVRRVLLVCFPSRRTTLETGLAGLVCPFRAGPPPHDARFPASAFTEV
jgi:hypothetical protein